MRALLSLLAVTVVAVVMAVTASSATGPVRNFDNGGGQAPIGQYIARVYIYSDGYWHWRNCLFIVYPWGAFQDRCW